ncbi:hypothetical protein [Flammeovirga kamogawensis]|uniref:Autotransporter outer membrane beta-barrel domain-containing protein n=1 Tax=Flammeovirga kamogawensis TaxID=373891 RepID=A0ABX8H0G8_9BACT|nr:hypothetical protein [Flammeovirga kamogawensis]MBB6462214.1 hypothetical protein [Flammeovirga kamogawensis]QWG09385.1 hypothetical protein KM029_22525 [Flammeovirga kamogawensis]TRX64903.1 hypothetical protein EO216_20435 [Flammeovirga kamogawensis]
MKVVLPAVYLLLLLSFLSNDGFSQKIENIRNFDRDIKKKVFIPKGQWLAGSTFQYSEHSNNQYQFLLLDNWDGDGYNLKVSPYVAYFIKDNFAIGGRFSYSRSELNIDNLIIDLGDDLSFNLDGASQVGHDFKASFFIRNYISLGRSNRFGIFNEVRLSYGYGESKELSVGEHPLDIRGIYTTTKEISLGISPGMVAFINNNIAIEASLDIIGLNYKWINQKENQVDQGTRRSGNANFNLDVFTLNIGVSLYI